MYEYENRAYATTNTGAGGGGQPSRGGPKPEPPVRSYKPYTPTPTPLRDYSSTDLNNSVTAHLDAELDLSPSGSGNRSTGSAGRYHQQDGGGRGENKPTPTPRARRNVPQSQQPHPQAQSYGQPRLQSYPQSQSTGGGPYSPHSHEVADINAGSTDPSVTSRPRGQTYNRDRLAADPSPPQQGDRHTITSPPQQVDRHTSDVPNAIADRNAHLPHTRIQSPRTETTPYGRHVDIKSPRNESTPYGPNSEVTSPTEQNTSRLSYRDRWEQQRAAKVRRSSREWPESNHRPAQVPEPASTSPPRATKHQEPEPATLTAYNRSILSSNRSVLTDQNRSYVSERNISNVASPPVYGYAPNSSVNRQRILSGEYRVHDPDRTFSPTARTTRPLTPSDTAKTPSSTLDTTNQDTSNEQQKPHRTGSVKAIKEGLLNASRRSLLNVSRLSLLRQSGGRNLTLYGNDWGVINSLLVLALLSVISVTVSFMSLQLLFHLEEEMVSSRHAPALMNSNDTASSVLEVAVSLTTIVLMLDICCLMLCAMQCFFAAKLLKCPQGEERAFKYLKECSGTRLIAVSGFFISLPVFLMSVLLYILLQFRVTAAIICTVILTIGFTFSLIVIIHSLYLWRVEKNKADLNIPPYDTPLSHNKNNATMSEFSTLV